MQVTEAILHYFQYAARRVHTLFVLQLDYIEAVADRITKIKNILENLTGGSEGKSETVNNKNNHVAAKLSAGFNTLQSLIQIHSDMWRLGNWQFFAADYNGQTSNRGRCRHADSVRNFDFGAQTFAEVLCWKLDGGASGG